MSSEPISVTRKPDKSRNLPVCFFVATICAFPFFILSVIGFGAILSKRQNFSDTLTLSTFALPILLPLALCAMICAILTWKRVPRLRALMVLYVIFVAAYWIMIKGFGPF
jgi:hypothetical protein